MVTSHGFMILSAEGWSLQLILLIISPLDDMLSELKFHRVMNTSSI